MAPKYIFLFALAAFVLATQAAPPAAGKPPGPTFVAKNIVKNVTKDCPVNNVLFTKDEFDADKLVELQPTLQNNGVSQKCQDEAVENLMSCLTDDSMTVKIGCCSKDCSAGIKKSIETGCFTEYAKAICSDPKAENMMVGLMNAGVRCADFRSNCTAIMAEAPKKAGNATSSKGASTPAAAAPAAAPAPPTKSSAVHATAAVVPLAAVFAAVLLL